MSFVFYILAAITVAGALAAVTLKNTVHCALALTVAFAGLALLFLELDAQFAGFAQILVYIGAVAILVGFSGLVIAAGAFAVLGWAVIKSGGAVPRGPDGTPTVTVLDIGNALMSRYVLPLEIVALLLTAAMIGAVLVAMHEKEEKK